jgi:hypothetical protein
MGTLSLRLPERMHKQLKELARREGISINQFITTAVAEKLTAEMTERYLNERGEQGDRARFDAVLARIPDAPPDAADRLEETPARRRRK